MTPAGAPETYNVPETLAHHPTIVHVLTTCFAGPSLVNFYPSLKHLLKPPFLSGTHMSVTLELGPDTGYLKLTTQTFSCVDEMQVQ